jgi:hypothetical protein
VVWSASEPLGGASTVDDVVNWRGALWAVGLDTTGKVGFWRSADAGAWSRVTTDNAVFAGATTINLLVDSSGLVAYGTATHKFVVWTSRDGTSWTRSDTQAFDGANVASLTSGPDGLVAVGDLGWNKPQIWSSSDGTVWQTIDLASGMFGDAHLFIVPLIPSCRVAS